MVCIAVHALHSVRILKTTAQPWLSRIKSQGKSTEAEPLYRRAMEICEKSLGADHPNTQTVRENYALLPAEMKS